MSKIRKTYKYRLYPTRAQSVVLDSQLALCCELYNAALQERRDAWRTSRTSIGFSAQSAQLPGIKVEREDVGGVYSQVLQDVLHRVDRSFDGFFRRAKRGHRAGFPRFRSRDRYDSMTYPQLGFDLETGHVKLSKIGRVKIKLHRPVGGTIKTLSLVRGAGKWYACFSVECDSERLPVSAETVGIDVGLAAFATLSDGTEVENPRFARCAERRMRVAQRKVARRKRRGNRRRKAVRELQAAQAHVRQQRADFHHKEARKLVTKYGLIAVEDLNVKGLARGMLAGSVHDVGWSAFLTLLAYKAANAGRVFVKVDPRGTSQTCLCGQRVPKTLSQRWHECQTCGLSLARDHVSALLILRLGLSLQASSPALAGFA